MDYSEVQFCRVVGDNVKFLPYLGRERGNALLEDLKFRRKNGGYVVAVYEDEVLELTPDCETHAEFCEPHLKEAPKPAKKSRRKTVKKSS